MKPYINSDLKGMVRQITISSMGSKEATITLLTRRDPKCYSEMRLAVTNILEHIDGVKGAILIEEQYSRLLQVYLSQGLPNFIEELGKRKVLESSDQEAIMGQMHNMSSNWSPTLF
jgi:hypothetical protein